MSELDDLIAQNKARDAEEFQREMDKYGPEQLDAATLHACHGCKYTWSTVYGTRPQRAVWIRERREWWHLRCYQAHQEREDHQRRERNQEIYLRAISNWFLRTDR